MSFTQLSASLSSLSVMGKSVYQRALPSLTHITSLHIAGKIILADFNSIPTAKPPNLFLIKFFGHMVGIDSIAWFGLPPNCYCVNWPLKRYALKFSRIYSFVTLKVILANNIRSVGW